MECVLKAPGVITTVGCTVLPNDFAIQIIFADKKHFFIVNKDKLSIYELAERIDAETPIKAKVLINEKYSELIKYWSKSQFKEYDIQIIWNDRDFDKTKLLYILETLKLSV